MSLATHLSGYTGLPELEQLNETDQMWEPHLSEIDISSDRKPSIIPKLNVDLCRQASSQSEQASSHVKGRGRGENDGGWICGNMLIQRRTTPFLRHFQRACSHHRASSSTKHRASSHHMIVWASLHHSIGLLLLRASSQPMTWTHGGCCCGLPGIH